MTSWSYIVYRSLPRTDRIRDREPCERPCPVGQRLDLSGAPSFTWTEKYPSANGTASAAIPGTLQRHDHLSGQGLREPIDHRGDARRHNGRRERRHLLLREHFLYLRGFLRADDVNSFVKGAVGHGFAGVSLFPSSKPTKGINLPSTPGLAQGNRGHNRLAEPRRQAFVDSDSSERRATAATRIRRRSPRGR